MQMPVRLCALILAVSVVALCSSRATAEKLRPVGPDQEALPGARRLAPGVETTVPGRVRHHDTFSRHDLPNLLKINADWQWAKDVRFEHDVWTLEFSFKPVRFIEIDVPQPDGKFRRERVWYLVYRVHNPSAEAVPFYPAFDLVDRETNRKYPSSYVPLATAPIERRERPPKRLLDLVSIEQKLPAAEEGADHSVWGLATWSGIDPRVDRFSVYIAGLTNAYRWQNQEDGGRRLFRKMLKLNFWRPGDEFLEHEREIRLGTPDEVDYEWVFR